MVIKLNLSHSNLNGNVRFFINREWFAEENNNSNYKSFTPLITSLVHHFILSENKTIDRRITFGLFSQYLPAKHCHLFILMQFLTRTPSKLIESHNLLNF